MENFQELSVEEIEIIKDIIKSKIIMRWPFRIQIIEQVLDECNYFPNKAEEHLLFALENNIDPIIAVRENKRLKLKEPFYMNPKKLLRQVFLRSYLKNQQKKYSKKSEKYIITQIK